ncbi:TPA: T9SS type A sorting domain-containing protein [Candidatus Poribacteria bacterium]|nr:T9SS type A sorting domain-containing protein [Candidatus Poribacteria bacterium]
MQQYARKRKNFAKILLYLAIAITLTYPIYQSFSDDSNARLDNDRSANPNLGNVKLDRVPGEVIIKFKSGSLKKEPQLKEGKADTSIESIDFILNQFKVYEIKKLIPKNIPEFNDIYHVKMPTFFNTTDLISLLKLNKYIEWAEPNYLFFTFDTPNDYNPAVQWGLAKIQATQAWDLTHGSTEVVIAIIDTGVDYNHPDLANNIWINPGEIAGNGLDDDDDHYYVDDVIGYDFVSVESGAAPGEDIGPPDNDPMDFHGHGTHCSGIASAVTNNGVGVAGTGWNCKIMAVRAGYKNTEGNGVLTLTDAVAALNYSADKGANIISMSWGSTSNSEDLLLAINYAKSKGCVLVAAAGNSGTTTKYYPAAYDGVIAVSASDQNDAKASFSNYGSWVDVAAPGVSIYSTMFNDIYSYASGTSMATPCVAGIAGLVMSINPLLNADDVANRIKNNADNVGWAKRVNAYRTVLNSIPLTVSVSPNAQAGQTVTITANVDISSDVEDLILYYKQGGKTVYQNMPFTLQSGTLKKGTWNAVIPANQVTTKGIIYYVELTDINGKKCYYGSASLPYLISVHGNIPVSLKSTPPKTPSVWNVVAPSVITDNKTVAGNFGSLGTFGVDWFAWRWNASANRWEVPQTYRSYPVSTDPFDVTVGWWITLMGDGSNQSIDVSGDSVNSLESYIITLNAGWNNIANPFDFPVAWSDENIRIRYSGNEVTPTQARSNLWVDNRIIWYDNTQNINVTKYSYENPAYSIPPKQGFWLYSAVNDAKLVIPPVEYPVSPAPPSIPNKEDIDSWKIILSFNTDIDKSRLEIVASKREIKKAENILGSINPPPNPFSLSHIELIKSEYISDQFIWEFNVITSIDGHLQWDFVKIPNDYSVVIEEYDTGKTIDLKQNSSIPISRNDSNKKFILKASRKYIPTQTRFFANYPNPFNPETWIPYQLSIDSEVTVKIYSSTGQLVKKIELGHKPAGFYTTKDKAIYWDGRNESGEIVSSGVYFYNIKAGDKIFNHKMVILR